MEHALVATTPPLTPVTRRAYASCMQHARPVAAGDASEALVALIGRVARGEQPALASLYDQTSSLVHGLAVKILRDESAAEDVTLDVYLQVFHQAPSYDPERGSPLGWLLTLARSRAIDRFRSEARRRLREAPLDTVEATAATAGDPAESALAGECARAVRDAVAALTAEQRRAIELAYYRGMTHTEIAEALGQPLGTIKTRIRTGMLALRDRLRFLHAEAGG
jgi:RNA polymerase sigma-70 factor (ECF subfamily)